MLINVHNYIELPLVTKSKYASDTYSHLPTSRCGKRLRAFIIGKISRAESEFLLGFSETIKMQIQDE